MQRIRKILAIAAISVMTVCTVPVQAENGGASDTIQIQPVTVKKSGFIKEGTKYFFYDKKGNKLKSKWKTIQKRRYYFKADGTAAVGGTKIGKYTYVFDLQGRLLKPSKSKIVQVGKKLYYVNKTFNYIKVDMDYGEYSKHNLDIEDLDTTDLEIIVFNNIIGYYKENKLIKIAKDYED